MKQIQLSGKNNNLYALVDDSNYDSLIRYKWYLHRKGYVRRNRRSINGIKDTLPISMHGLVLGSKEGFVIDHINNNKLDNRKENLRFITNRQNIRRRGKQKNSKTGYKGVYVCKTKGLKSLRYNVYIRVNKKLLFVGYFKNKIKAAKAYNVASKKYHGEFGYQNIV
jgi:hypothetical protein